MEQELIDVLNTQFKKYPKMQIEDIFKLIYQQEFGPTHLLSSSNFKEVFDSLKKEAIINNNQNKEKEYIGNGYYRYNLVNDDNYLTSLTYKFIYSCNKDNKNINDFKETLYQLTDYVYLYNIDKDTYLKKLKEYEIDGFKAILHSLIYKDNYDPHYRVIKEIDRKELAINYFKEGYNCSQSVVLAFEDLLNIDRTSLLKIASSFGGGIARLREVCGAVSSIAIVIGLLYGYDTPDTGNNKNEHYKRVQELALTFERENKSIVCRDLLNLNVKHDNYQSSKRDTNFYESRPCIKLIENAVIIIEEYMKREANN